MRYSPTSPTRPRERSRFQLTPDSVGGTAADAETLLLYIYSGAALRCISPHPLSPDALSGVN